MSTHTTLPSSTGPQRGDDSLAPVDRVFFDGHCGLCHRTVRFALRRDHDGSRFRFAPLQGETFAARLGPERRAGLPDSLVVVTADDRLLTRTDAVLHLCRRLGGGWRLAARVLRLVPRPLRDLAYDGVARLRNRLFRRPTTLCPRMAPELRARFDP